MAYTVLARKYRSRNFDELIGQDAVATTLRNAVESGRIHHGYLFTGTRGVGKTSTARILAKSLNCLKSDGPTISPCLECESCRMIAEGEDIDVVEIDAASNTGVDNIRDLRSNAVYRPARSRFKVYIIDEVHMLSTGAFNALLKTLEEPPEHVKFILATTEIQKVPATIQSRCQRFDFRSIDADTIGKHLRSLLKDEGIEAEDLVVRRVARLANGSMRDALSLLDQLLAFGSGKLDEALIEEILPAAHDEMILAMVDQIGGQDPAAALMSVEKCLGSGQTSERMCEALMDHLRTLMLLKVCGPDTDLVDASSAILERLVEQSNRFDAATYVYMIALVQELRRSIKFSAAGRALIDAAVVRLALTEQFSDLKKVLSSVASAPATSTGTADQKKKSVPVAEDEAGQVAVGKANPDSSKRALPSEAQGSGEPTPALATEEYRSAKVGGAVASPITAETRQRVLNDPAVRRAMDLFEGSLIEITPSATASALKDASTDSTSDESQPREQEE